MPHPRLPAIITIMPSTITIDAAGRLVVPLPVRRRLRLVAGSRLRITEGPHSILLEPEYEEARIEEKGGILVVVTLNPADFEQLAAEVGPRIVVPPDPPRVTAG